MNSLRNRIALLLFLAIVTVVSLATLAASTVLSGPPPESMFAFAVQRFNQLVTAIEADPGYAVPRDFALKSSSELGFDDEKMSRIFARQFEKAGLSRKSAVVRNSGRRGLTASVQLQSGQWLVAEVPDIGTRVWWILAGWITLIILGSTAVSIFAASKITKPLRLLDGAVTAVSEDGAIPHIPEIGSEEVRTTARTINRLSERLKAATESRMRLIAAAGHDMRTPMTRMRLRAEFIADDTDRQKWLNDLTELSNIADSAISLVREEIMKESVKHTRLDLVVCEIANELSSLSMKVELRGLLPLSIVASPLALKRALRNLVINSATHGEGAGINMEQTRQTAVIIIEDNGPGIPPELLDKVFEPFFRVDRSRRKTIFGAGLGLAIAKEIIERFGGSVTVANRRPRGLVQKVVFDKANIV